ncbi:MAG: flagellar basal body-associated protein FliL, partial [Nitrospinota bacterium]
VEGKGTMFPLPSFIVNLADVGGNRFIKVTFQLELSNGRLAEEITKRLPQVQDQIITVLSSKKMEDVTDADGKFKLKSEIMRRLNQFMTTGAVSNIYYTEFVVQ